MAKVKKMIKKNKKPRSSSKRSAKAPVKRVAKAKASRVRKITRIEALDQMLLKLAAKPYDKIIKQIKSSRKRLNEERRLALQVGGQILNKAKKVRDSLISTSKKP
ncbi:MAG: hypothetical protein KDD38_00650 [Bdellovibrionales bacterium]|nr:hypothetical protein [Bdellovibrionales bacterium]